MDDYFTFELPVEDECRNSVVSRYMDCPDNAPLSILDGHRVIHDVFLRYNTAVPSSAAVERLFSVAADIFTRKRGKLTDKNFEIQLLLKANEGLISI